MDSSKPNRVPLPTLDEGPGLGATLPAAPAGLNPAARPGQPIDKEELEKKIVAQLRTCYDPEIPIDIYELGLIYGIDIASAGDVKIRMTLTSPACPAAGSLPGEVERKAASVAGVCSAKVDIVWDPPWDPSRMTEAARLQLGLDYD
jgi:FeS assembly SUF system protein